MITFILSATLTCSVHKNIMQHQHIKELEIELQDLNKHIEYQDAMIQQYAKTLKESFSLK